jgi:hypothetical protein
MAPRATRWGLIWLAVHFLLIVLVSADDIFALVGQGSTLLPNSMERLGRAGAEITGAILQNHSRSKSPFHAATAVYLECAGIESAYGYFAPNVPEASQLLFEIHFPDGRVAYELPVVTGSAAGLRLVSLLDCLARPNFAPVREYVLQKMVEAIRTEHPEVGRVRAIFNAIVLPGIAEFEQGRRAFPEPLFIYEFEPGESQGRLIQ